MATPLVVSDPLGAVAESAVLAGRPLIVAVPHADGLDGGAAATVRAAAYWLAAQGCAVVIVGEPHGPTLVDAMVQAAALPSRTPTERANALAEAREARPVPTDRWSPPLLTA
jgi:hypothetical protein